MKGFAYMLGNFLRHVVKYLFVVLNFVSSRYLNGGNVVYLHRLVALCMFLEHFEFSVEWLRINSYRFWREFVFSLSWLLNTFTLFCLNFFESAIDDSHLAPWHLVHLRLRLNILLTKFSNRHQTLWNPLACFLIQLHLLLFTCDHRHKPLRKLLVASLLACFFIQLHLLLFTCDHRHKLLRKLLVASFLTLDQLLDIYCIFL